MRFFQWIWGGGALSLCWVASAFEVPSDWIWGLDETLIDQYHGSFNHSRPDGPNSFISSPENSYSNVIGLNLGHQYSDHGEWWLRTETIRGIPFSQGGGLGALTNNDMQRTMNNYFQTYLAEAFWHGYWSWGEVSQSDPSAVGSFARMRGTHELDVVVGKLDLLQYFDTNSYAGRNDNQFMNWCFMASCGFDYAADLRGYTLGGAVLLDWDAWSVRAGWFALPLVPNGLILNTQMTQQSQVDFEVERRWPGGDVKLLGYQSQMNLASYVTANQLPGPVSIVNVPRVPTQRGGAGLNAQQEIVPGVGVFARAFWTGGQSETMAFTEVDRSQSVGISLDGLLWGRSLDGIGVGWVRNEINSARQTFLTNGNLDLFIGDGYLSYGAETALEAYYRWALNAHWALTVDDQWIENPAYNQWRGPITIGSIRVHFSY